jgi:hypothetical protein
MNRLLRAPHRLAGFVLRGRQRPDADEEPDASRARHAQEGDRGDTPFTQAFSPSSLSPTTKASVRAFAHGRPQFDDITRLALMR